MPIIWTECYSVECDVCHASCSVWRREREEAVRVAIDAWRWNIIGRGIYCPRCVAAGRVPPGPDGKPA